MMELVFYVLLGTFIVLAVLFGVLVYVYNQTDLNQQCEQILTSDQNN